MRDDVSAAYDAASGWFVDLVARVPEPAWSQRGLGDWSVLELVAHTSRAHTTVVEYLLHPRPPEALDGPYFTPQAIAERGRASVRELGASPPESVAQASHAARDLVARTGGDAVLSGPAGTTTLADYLPSRVAELVVHGLDLAAATGSDAEPPDSALGPALSFVATRAARRRPVEVLRALTGRGALPDGYSVY